MDLAMESRFDIEHASNGYGAESMSPTGHSPRTRPHSAGWFDVPGEPGARIWCAESDVPSEAIFSRGCWAVERAFNWWAALEYVRGELREARGVTHVCWRDVTVFDVAPVAEKEASLVRVVFCDRGVRGVSFALTLVGSLGRGGESSAVGRLLISGTVEPVSIDAEAEASFVQPTGLGAMDLLLRGARELASREPAEWRDREFTFGELRLRAGGPRSLPESGGQYSFEGEGQSVVTSGVEGVCLEWRRVCLGRWRTRLLSAQVSSAQVSSAQVSSAQVEQTDGKSANALVVYLVDEVARALRVPASAVDVDLPMTELGVDSLTAVHVRNRIEVDVGVVVPVAKLIAGASLRQLALWLADEARAPSSRATGGRQPTSEPSEAPLPGSSELLAQLDDMSSEAVDALLSRLLREREGREE